MCMKASPRVPCVPYPINRPHTNYLIDFYEYGKNTIDKSESLLYAGKDGPNTTFFDLCHGNGRIDIGRD